MASLSVTTKVEVYFGPLVITAPFKKTDQTPRLLGAFATRGAVPCLSADLTTHAVPQFIQALKKGRRTAPKARGAKGAKRFLDWLRRRTILAR